VKVVYSPEHQRLAPPYSVEAGVQGAPPDVPERVEAILRDLRADDGFAIEAPTEHGLEPILALHDPGLVAFLETAWDLWTAEGWTQPLYPDTFMHRSLRDGMGPVREPGSVLARMGYWCFETFTPIVEGSYTAARAAVDVALTGADHLLAGEPLVYGLCRPPGHHVGQRIFGGSSYLNNAAITAESIARRTGEPVAVLDLDYHHGNGTQQLFYERPDVLYVSLHGDPTRAWPYFTGHADETGVGAGEGTTRNFPLPAGCSDEPYIAALDEALEVIARHGAPRLVVSLGFDTYRLDGEDLELTNSAFHTIGGRIAAGGRPTLVLQEGGYYVPHLGRNAVQWLRGAEGRAFEPDENAP
jgi:acetoin utilization deacetylase AcuC-like enzyme